MAVGGIGVFVGSGFGVEVGTGVADGGLGIATTGADIDLPQAADPTAALDDINFVIRPPLAPTELTVEDLRPTDENVTVFPSGDHTGDWSFEDPEVIFF